MKKTVLSVMMLFLCLSLTGCKSGDYKDATKLQDEGKYEEASKAYQQLGDYEDSTERKNECDNMVLAIEGYNKAKADLEKKNSDLESSIQDAEALIAEKKTALDDSLNAKLETAISNAKSSKKDAIDMKKDVDGINESAEEMSSIDYTSVLEKLNGAYKALEKSIKQFSLVNTPKEQYVIKCLKKVPHVVDISAVTEKNDPNGHLNKAGGYTAQVYFSSDLVNQSEVSGNTVIDKGTDCGGSIEVYATVEDANKRNDYLASFDGGIFASGSHSVVGSVLVRTSDELTASQQKKMEKKIIKELTDVQ